MMQSETKVNEGVEVNDLKSLIGNLVSIDQYKTKLGEDKNFIVMGITIDGKDPASDLSQFVETGHDVLDVDISNGPNKDGMYTVFVEVERDSKAFDKINAILNDIRHLDEQIGDMMFTSYENKSPTPFNQENFNSNVISDSYTYTLTHNPEAKAIAERMKFLNSY